MVRPCYQDQKALGARKTSARPLRQPKEPGKSRLDRFRSEIEALLSGAWKPLKLDEEERDQEAKDMRILLRNRYICWVWAKFSPG